MIRSLDYVFQPDAQTALDHFSGLFGIRVAFFGADGSETLVGRAQPGCDYCRLLRTRLGLDEICRCEDQRRIAEARQAGDLIHYTCHGGLCEAVMPIRIADWTIGFAMLGQVRCKARIPAAYGRRWRREVGGQELQEAFARVPSITPEQLGSVLGMFRVLVEYMAQRRLVAVRGDDLLAPILARLEARPDEPFSLGDAARMIHRSPSLVSHLFQKTLGRSFRQVRTDLRLDRAEQLLRDQPDLTVQEVAARTGFEDPLYFSRLFRRHRGCPPSAIRADRERRSTGDRARVEDATAGRPSLREPGCRAGSGPRSRRGCKGRA